MHDPKSNPWRGLQVNVDDGGGDGRVSGGSPPGQLPLVQVDHTGTRERNWTDGSRKGTDKEAGDYQ